MKSVAVTSEVGAYNSLYKYQNVSSNYCDIISRQSPGGQSPACSLSVVLLAVPRFYGRPVQARLAVVRLYGSWVGPQPVN